MKFVAAVVLCCLAPMPAAAELKYIVRMEARRVATLANADPALTKLGTKILAAVVPGDSVELTVIVGDRVARVQWSKALPGIPAGTVLLQRQNGSRVMVNAAEGTYWRSAMPDLYAMQAANRPVVTQTPGSESEMVTGLPAIRSSVKILIPYPEARAGLLVSGTPPELPLTGDVWVTESLARYSTRELRPILGLALLGFDIAPLGQFVLRQVLRGPLFGETELESAVLAVVEEDVPDALFEVPAGFREVPAPRITR